MTHNPTQTLTLSAALSAVLSVAALTACGDLDQPPQVTLHTWQSGRDAAVSITFDDGMPLQLAVAAPMLERHGFRGTFYLIADRVADYAPWRTLADKGHEIGSHTLTHPNLAELHHDRVETELRQSKQLLEDSIGHPVASIAYPYCVPPADTALVKRLYVAARHCQGRIEPPSPASYADISSFGVGAESSHFATAAPVEQLIDSTRALGGWLTLLLHEVADGPGYSAYSEQALDSTLRYLHELDDHIWVAPFATVAKYATERDSVRLTTTVSDNAILLNLASTLDPARYDVPLTLSFPLPTGWKAVNAVQDGREISVKAVDGTVWIDLLPGAKVALSER